MIRPATASMLILGALLQPLAVAADETMAVDAQRNLLEEYCLGCHNFSDNKGGLALELFDPGKPTEDAPVSEKMPEEAARRHDAARRRAPPGFRGRACLRYDARALDRQ